MGDHFQTIVDCDASPDEAATLAVEIVQWLVERGIIEPNQRDCALGMGYPPGVNYREAVNQPEGATDFTLRLATNGVQVISTRTVFHAGQNGLGLVCRHCGNQDDGGEAWGDAVQEWYDGKADAQYACPKCGYSELVIEWMYDPPWGFGNLGFEFWNWLPLNQSFVRELSARLKHRTVVVRGKL